MFQKEKSRPTTTTSPPLHTSNQRSRKIVTQFPFCSKRIESPKKEICVWLHILGFTTEIRPSERLKRQCLSHNRRSRDPSCAYTWWLRVIIYRWVLLCCKLIGEHTKKRNQHGFRSSLFQVVFSILFSTCSPCVVARQAFTAQVDVFLFRLALYIQRA
jgi:hypothetical protein